MIIPKYICRVFLVGMFLVPVQLVKGQQQEVRLADEYFQNAEYEKARVMYQKLSKNHETARQIHKNYLEALKNLQQWDEAEKFLKREIKANPDAVVYKLEQAVLLEKQGKASEGVRVAGKAIEEVRDNPAKVMEAAQFGIENGKPEWAEKVFTEGRRKSGNKTAYAFQLAQLYRLTNNMEKMMDEYLTVAM